MRKSIEVTGKTEEEAISAALNQLSLERDDVSVEIIARAKPGFFGLGASPAVIKVYYETEPSNTEKTENFLQGLLEHMEVSAQVSVHETENGISAELKGESMGLLIGRRGETLDAIQHLTSYVVNKGDSKRVRINVDAENYRKKREDALCSLAKKTAEKAIKYRRNMSLEPMNSYERHVIHTALQEYNGVTTYSTGTEPHRCVVVAYDRKSRNSARG